MITFEPVVTAGNLIAILFMVLAVIVMHLHERKLQTQLNTKMDLLLDLVGKNHVALTRGAGGA